MNTETRDKFLQKLKQYERGLDTAGSHESAHFEDYAHDIEEGVDVEVVMNMIRARYLPHNPDIVNYFESLLP